MCQYHTIFFQKKGAAPNHRRRLLFQNPNDRDFYNFTDKVNTALRPSEGQMPGPG